MDSSRIRNNVDDTGRIAEKVTLLFLITVLLVGADTGHSVNGYFELTAQCQLIYYEETVEEKQVIETFFYVDTDKMKAALPKQETKWIASRIHVTNKQEYESVLSTFDAFAIEG